MLRLSIFTLPTPCRSFAVIFTDWWRLFALEEDVRLAVESPLAICGQLLFPCSSRCMGTVFRGPWPLLCFYVSRARMELTCLLVPPLSCGADLEGVLWRILPMSL